MMATMAALLGAVPLVIATGPGSELRRRSLRIIEIGGITNVLLLERNKPRDGPDSNRSGSGIRGSASSNRGPEHLAARHRRPSLLSAPLAPKFALPVDRFGSEGVCRSVCAAAIPPPAKRWPG